MGKIGIMGGTFDPIHNGHLFIGKQALIEYDLDAVWYMPSGQPPHKNKYHVTGTDMRCAMVKLAIESEPGFIFSDFEVKRKGNTYTAQTLDLLQQCYPEHHFYFILGADSLYEIENWYHPEQIMEHVVILVAGREYEGAHLSIEEQITYLTKRYHGRIYRLHCMEVDISSEEIRSMSEKGKSITKYVPEHVVQYIENQHLYKGCCKEDGQHG